MIHYQLMRDDSGTAISVYNIGTINTITTESIKAHENKGIMGLLFVIAGGTVATLQRQASFDNVNFYDIYDSNGTNLTNLSANVFNSRFVVFNNVDSSDVVAPYMRFKFVGTGTITTITNLFYVNQE